MGLFANIGRLIGGITTAVSEFVSNQKETDNQNKKVVKEFFEKGATEIGDLVETAEGKIDLRALVGEDGFIDVPTEFEDTKAGQKEAKKYALLLDNFYDKEVKDGKIIYTLNAYGQELDADGDGKISLEEVKSVDQVLEHNTIISQFDINLYKKHLDEKWQAERQPKTLAILYFADEVNGNYVGGTRYYEDTEEGNEKLYHDKYLLEAFYEPAEAEEGASGKKYVFNKYARAIDTDGDGKITQQELNAVREALNLETDLTLEEFEKWKKEFDKKEKEREKIEKEKANPTSLLTYADEEREIKSPLIYEDTEEGNAQLEHDKLLLNSLYKKVESDDGKITYVFTDAAAKLAGEDGIISKDELKALDKNKDGKVTQKEAEKYTTKSNIEDDVHTVVDAFLSTNTFQKLTNIFRKRK